MCSGSSVFLRSPSGNSYPYIERWPSAYMPHNDVSVTPVMWPRTTTSTGSGVAARASSAFGSGTDTTWFAITSAVCSNHHADS